MEKTKLELIEESRTEQKEQLWRIWEFQKAMFLVVGWVLDLLVSRESMSGLVALRAMEEC